MKNKKIIFSAIFVVLILLVIYIVFFTAKNTDQFDPYASTPVGQNVMVGDVNSKITNEVEKTNPFKADVNPLNGYKNPFAK